MSRSKTTANAIGIILAGLIFSSVASCGGPKASVREIPPELYSRLDRGVTSYGEAGRELFAAEESRFASLVTKFTGGLHRTLHPKFRHDPRLDSVAWLVAHAFADKETRVAPELTEWVVNRLGIVGHVRMTPAWYGEGSWGKQHVSDVLPQISREMRRADWDGERYAFGVARLRVPPERFAMGLVVVEQTADLEEIPKRVEPGGTIVLRGRTLVASEFAAARLSVSDLESYLFLLPTDRNDRFSVEIPAPTVPGTHRLSAVSWSRVGGGKIIFDVPINVGVDEPARPDASILAPASNPPPGPEWERRIETAINEERRRAGLEPLARAPELDAVIGARILGAVAKPYRRRPPMRESLMRAGLEWAHWSVEETSFEFLAELLGELNQRPDYRQALLNPRYSRLGVATAAIPRKGRGPQLYSAGYIFQRPLPSDGRTLSERLRAALLRETLRYDDTAVSPAGTGSSPAEGFAAELEQALAGPTGGRMRHEPALDVVAAEYLANGSLPGAVENFVLRRLGITGTLTSSSTRLVRRSGPGPHLTAELAALATFHEAARNLEFRFGVAREPRGDGLFAEAVALVVQEVAFEPFPRRVEPGEEFVVEGRFLTRSATGSGCGINLPMLWLEGEGRKIANYRLQLDADCGFTLKVTAPGQPGTYRMEIIHSPLVLADRRVELSIHEAAEAEIVVGGPGAPEPDPALMKPVDEPAARAERMEILRRKLREFRTAAGLAPLEENRLATVLLADHMLREYYMRGTPTFQRVADTLKSNGGGDWTLGFGGGLFRVAESMDLRFANPAVREYLLDPSTIGYGLATDPDGEIYRILFLKQYEGEGDKGAGADSRFGTASRDEAPLPHPAVLAPAAVSEALEKGRKKLIRCFKDEAAWVDDDYEVTARFGLAVGAAGKVIAAWPEDDRADPRGLEACILDELRALPFPAPTPGAHGPGAVIVSRELRFTRRGEDKVELALAE